MTVRSYAKVINQPEDLNELREIAKRLLLDNDIDADTHHMIMTAIRFKAYMLFDFHGDI